MRNPLFGFIYNGVISLIFTFNEKKYSKTIRYVLKKYYLHKNKKYVINTELHICYILFLLFFNYY